MQRGATIVFAILLWVMALRAEPLVIGFERFHATKATAEGGRLLHNELGCANCHGGEMGLPTRRGPDLNGVTRRVRAEWLRKFLANPANESAGTDMPQLLPANIPGDVEAVLHYLATLKPASAAKSSPIVHVNAARGGELFHTVGCVACHAPGKDFQPPDEPSNEAEFTHRSVSFPKLAGKYSLATLGDFIRDPLKVRPDGRMPRLELSMDDAVDIAGYLLDFQGSDGRTALGIKPFTADKAMAERGRTIVAMARCAACHDLPKDVAAHPVALRRLDGGCLNTSASPGVPNYELSEVQRAALKLFIEQIDQPALPQQLASLTLEALNCLACHERDGRGGPEVARKAYFLGNPNLGDTGRYPPPLTGAGRKLQPDWMEKVLNGEARVRPYMQTMMPEFGAAVASLGALLGEVDAKPGTPLPLGDDAAGRRLLGTHGGNSCITCHRWGDRPSLGIQALDLSNLHLRLQPGWLREYLVNPAAYQPGTLMPSFWPKGIAANRDVCGGDTDRQIASIYSFAKSAKGEPEGFPDTTSGEYELIPKDRPIVQRTFMEGVGTHAILVGFPTGAHLAYDGKRARPAIAWKGKFFNAYNTWFSRFAPFENPPGDSIVKWPATTARDPEVRFDGYRLDQQGTPTFLYSVGGLHVEERFQGIKNGFQRTITWDASSSTPPDITHPDGVTITEDPVSTAGARVFIYQWK